MICRALIVIGLLMALVAAANAEPAAVVVPAGTTTIEPSPDVRFLVTRASLERALATDELAKERRRLWLECESRAARLTQSEPRWLTITKYVGLGVLLGGVFSLGVLAAE